MENIQKFRAVQYDKYGGIDVLHVDEINLPKPGSGQILIKVKAAGINPGEATIRQGVFAKQWPATFPSGQGSDFAGIEERRIRYLWRERDDSPFTRDGQFEEFHIAVIFHNRRHDKEYVCNPHS